MDQILASSMFSGSCVPNRALLAVVLMPVLRDLLTYAHGAQDRIYGQTYGLLPRMAGVRFPARHAYHYPRLEHPHMSARCGNERVTEIQCS